MVNGTAARAFPVPGTLEERRLSNLKHNLGELAKYLTDPDITDISVLDTGRLILKYFDKGKEFTDMFFSESQRTRILNDISSINNYAIDYSNDPVLESIVPGYGCRIQGQFPPRVKAPTFVIRKPLGRVIPIEDYVKEKRLSDENYRILLDLVKNRKNILIGGSTGSGKTTFTSAVIQKMVEFTPEDSFYIIEDVPELICNAADNTMVVVRPENTCKAVLSALRWNPDRIIFGELRYGQTTDELLTAWNTGHTGNIATIHANSADAMITRVETLLRKVIQGQIPDVTESINACVFLEYKRDFGPFIKEIKILS